MKNDDLISRRLAIYAIWNTEQHDVKITAKYNRRLKQLVKIINAVAKLPSAEPQRWIPVAERLPIKEFEEGRKNRTVYDIYPCLVTRYSTHTDKPRSQTYVCKSYFDGEDFMLHGGYAPNEESDTENTLAWMPLPAPWKGEDDGEGKDSDLSS